MGDRAAEAASFDALYRDTSVDLLAFLLRRCRTPDDAADCLAETYLVAWNKRAKRPADDQLRPWLFGIARNVALRGHQHDGRLAAATAALANELSAAAAAHHDAGDAARARLREALTLLSRVDQEIMTMISLDGLKPAEVAKILGMSANVVRVRAHRSRARVRAELAATRDTPEVTAAGQVPANGPNSPT
jgi:RNA polymerase sigma-70 factor (ECF subfamily)